MALGTAPRRVAPGVWVTAQGRRLTDAGARYWEGHYRAGTTDGLGHVRRLTDTPGAPPLPVFKPKGPTAQRGWGEKSPQEKMNTPVYVGPSRKVVVGGKTYRTAETVPLGFGGASAVDRIPVVRPAP